MTPKEGPRCSLEQRIYQHSIPVPECGCWLWTGTQRGNNRYGGSWDGERNTPAHRLSWRAFRGPIPDGMNVLHRCDTPTCVNPEHLFLGTHADNMRDMAAKGRNVSPDLRGERCGTCKLMEKEVLEIISDHRVHREIAADYGIARSSVGDIKRGRSWAHLRKKAA